MHTNLLEMLNFTIHVKSFNHKPTFLRYLDKQFTTVS